MKQTRLFTHKRCLALTPPPALPRPFAIYRSDQDMPLLMRQAMLERRGARYADLLVAISPYYLGLTIPVPVMSTTGATRSHGSFFRTLLHYLAVLRATEANGVWSVPGDWVNPDDVARVRQEAVERINAQDALVASEGALHAPHAHSLSPAHTHIHTLSFATKRTHSLTLTHHTHSNFTLACQLRRLTLST